MQWTGKKGIWWKQYQNETATRQRQDSVTVSKLKVRKINTPLLLPIHYTRHRSAAASVVVFDTLDALSILRRRICCPCCSLCNYLPPRTPPLLYIHWVLRLTPTASVVVSDLSDASSIPHPLMTPPSSSLSPLARLTLPTPPSLLSIPYSRKNTCASIIRDLHSDALYLLLPQLTPLLSSSRSRAHLPLTTHLSWLPFTKARHRNAGATVVVPKYSIPWPFFLFLVLIQRLCCCRRFRGLGSERILTVGFLTLYLFWWRFAHMTLGRGCLPNLVGDGTVENSWGVNLIPRLLNEGYTILWFEFDLFS